jgi:hypothetical protein
MGNAEVSLPVRGAILSILYAQLISTRFRRVRGRGGEEGRGGMAPEVELWTPSPSQHHGASRKKGGRGTGDRGGGGGGGGGGTRAGVHNRVRPAQRPTAVRCSCPVAAAMPPTPMYTLPARLMVRQTAPEASGNVMPHPDAALSWDAIRRPAGSNTPTNVSKLLCRGGGEGEREGISGGKRFTMRMVCVRTCGCVWEGGRNRDWSGGKEHAGVKGTKRKRSVWVRACARERERVCACSAHLGW